MRDAVVVEHGADLLVHPGRGLSHGPPGGAHGDAGELEGALEGLGRGAHVQDVTNGLDVLRMLKVL